MKDGNAPDIETRLILKDIYLKHDVRAFREFIRDYMQPSMRDYLSKSDADLDQLMWEAKAQAPFLGEEWQHARNVCRRRQFGYTAKELEAVRFCSECKWFREKGSGASAPCMHLRASPHDIQCRGFLAIEG